MSNQNQKLACSTLREAAKMLRLKDCGAHAEQCEKAAEKLEKEINLIESIINEYSKEVRKNDIFWSKDFWGGYEAGWRDTENALKDGRIEGTGEDRSGGICRMRGFW